MGVDPLNDPQNWLRQNLNDPRVLSNQARRAGYATNGIEHVYPRPKPRDPLVREAEEHSLRFYLRDHMKAAADREASRDLSDRINYFCNPPRRSEDGPHTDYFRLLKAEREERLGRIETVSADAARPARADADGRGGRGLCEGQVRVGPNGIDGPGDEWAGTGGNRSC